MNKKALRTPALFLFGIFLIYACVLSPLYQYIANDFVLSDTLWFDVVDFFFQLFEMLGISLAIAFLCRGVYQYTYKKCLPLYLLCVGALLFKYVAAIIANAIVIGTLDLTADYSELIVSFFCELFLLALAVFLTHRFTYRRVCEDKEKARAAKTLGKEYVPTADYLPFRKLFSRQNHLQRAIFWSILAVAIFRVISYIIWDIAYSLMGAFFTAADIPITLLYWLLLIFLPAFLGYLLSLFLLNRMKSE